MAAEGGVRDLQWSRFSMTGRAALVADGVVDHRYLGLRIPAPDFIAGWDPATGKRLRRTTSIPFEPNEPGGDTWKGDDVARAAAAPPGSPRLCPRPVRILKTAILGRRQSRAPFNSAVSGEGDNQPVHPKRWWQIISRPADRADQEVALLGALAERIRTTTTRSRRNGARDGPRQRQADEARSLNAKPQQASSARRTAPLTARLIAAESLRQVRASGDQAHRHGRPAARSRDRHSRPEGEGACEGRALHPADLPRQQQELW